jgi:predicted alpha-1,2-mannosidase
MSPKTADGEWVPNFDPKLSGGQGGRAYFAECNSWTYTLSVQHDIEGLSELMGGRKGLETYLDTMLSEQYGTSKYVFLGLFPDSTGLIGQFCMGNEPSFHIPYLYNYTDSPWKTQKLLREIMKVWFDDTPIGICGDEDGGAMSAWYVFSAMGFYPTCPGKPEYDIGSPLFDEVKIHLPSGKTFTIVAQGNSNRAKYIQKAEIDGKPLCGTKISHQDIVDGATIVFTMGEKPAKSL